jgi:hypothetical protein
MDLERVEAALHALYVAVDGARLREEDRRKAVEVAAMLDEVARLRRDALLVDAAAGKGYVGLLALELLGFERVHLIEREPVRAEATRVLASKRFGTGRCTVSTGDVSDREAWPEDPDAIVALHACGVASDHVIDAAIRSHTRWLMLVPCCYGSDVTHAALAEEQAERVGIPRHPEIRRRFVQAWIDSERTLRLEASGYETTALALVAPTVTPHNLLLRARRSGEPRRAHDAAVRRATMVHHE